ncbi:MAG: dipicolinate synthase subunit B [Clostridiales bacterium]|nr:dipicolinate synthase subunit B [Clostridiales bacterium]
MNIGYCLTGSFCTFEKSIAALERLVKNGHSVTPIMSENAYSLNTRFGNAVDIQSRLIEITGNSIIHTIEQAEPIEPKKIFDVLAIVPYTGNTLAKLATGVMDTSVTMAVKSHLRNGRCVVIGISTNDALGATAKNISMLLNYKNYYFVPFSMDNCTAKPKFMVCNFELVEDTINAAVKGIEIDKKIY